VGIAKSSFSSILTSSYLSLFLHLGCTSYDNNSYIDNVIKTDDYSLKHTMVTMKRDYFWLKRIIECRSNKIKHRPALIMLIKLYEAKWKSKPNANLALLKVGIKNLKHSLKQV